MDYRARVNGALRKLTGYQLTRARPPAPPAPPRPAPAARKKKRPPEPIPNDYDDEVREILKAIRGRTMTHHTKVQALVESVRYVERHRIPGAIVECGVWRGGSMLAVAHTLLQLGVTDRELYLFDTFTGMTPPTAKDIDLRKGKHAEEYLNATGPGPMAWSRPDRHVATLDDVKQGFAGVDYPEERLHYVVGAVEETVPEEAPEEIAILRLDTDWYESTKHELEHLYPRLSPGGVLVLDDYGSWQGARDATDEWLDATGEPLLLVRVHRGRFSVKPGLSSRV